MSTATPRDSADDLQCRLYRETDLPGLLHLWESQSSWGALTEDTWNAWYRNTPHGDSIIVVTANGDGDIVGQMVFTPTHARIAGREVKALRMSAPIFSRFLRTADIRNTQHPVLRMYSTGVAEGIARGVGILYAFPTHKWLPVWRSWKARGVLMGRAFGQEFGCIALDLAEHRRSEGANGMSVAVVGDATEEHAALWQRACAEFPVVCALDRSLAWLRYNRGRAIGLEARRDDGTLTGYAVIRRKGLLADFFVSTPSETVPVLKAIMRWLAEARAASSINFESLKIMETPHFAAAARSIGGVRVAFDFAFVCATVAADVPDIAIDPGNWYLTPGD
jgi:hypothetical protein